MDDLTPKNLADAAADVRAVAGAYLQDETGALSLTALNQIAREQKGRQHHSVMAFVSGVFIARLLRDLEAATGEAPFDALARLTFDE